jgi:CHAT domain-containing protein
VAQPGWGSWQDNLPKLLEQLNHILNIPSILAAIPNSQIQNLILIPHLDLHRFPLHSLFPNHFTITYLPSVQIGRNLQHQPSVQAWDSQSLLSVEHPNSAGLEILPYAQIESAIISQLFPHPTTKRISDNAASKTAVQTSLEAGYSIFHFTGHASYDSKRPQQSALYLSGGDRLTLAEICNLNLNSYQLVSLSSCETAITGNETITEEYVGLVSAFLYKGVSYVISSLWTVNEVSSSLLMIYFYMQLKQVKSPAIAFTAAINWLRHLTYTELETYYQNTLSTLLEHEQSCRKVLETYLKSNQDKQGKLFDSPYHWAAFTITGKYN